MKWCGWFEVKHYDAQGRLVYSDCVANNLAREGQFDVLDCFFRGGGSVPSRGFELALFDDIPEVTDRVSDLTGEPVDNGYARQVLERGRRGWPVLGLDAEGYRVISSAVTFRARGGQWGPVRSVVLIAKGLDVPRGLTVVPRGVLDSARWVYTVTAVNKSGETLPAPSAETLNGSVFLSDTSYNELSWEPVAGALKYKVYRLTGDVGCIGIVDTPYFVDNGQPADGCLPPTSDTSGRHISFAVLKSPLILRDGEVFDVAYKVRLVPGGGSVG